MAQDTREDLLNTFSVIILDLLTPKELTENNAETLIPYIKNAINKISSQDEGLVRSKTSILEEIRKQIKNTQEAYAAPASSDQILDACSVIIRELSSYNQRTTVSDDKIKEAITSVSLEGWKGDFDNLEEFRVGGSASISKRILDRITPPGQGGRRRSNQSKKRSAARRRRSSKRKVRKARTTRRR
jgi:hypothetical protein